MMSLKDDKTQTIPNKITKQQEFVSGAIEKTETTQPLHENTT